MYSSTIKKLNQLFYLPEDAWYFGWQDKYLTQASLDEGLDIIWGYIDYDLPRNPKYNSLEDIRSSCLETGEASGFWWFICHSSLE